MTQAHLLLLARFTESGSGDLGDGHIFVGDFEIHDLNIDYTVPDPVALVERLAKWDVQSQMFLPVGVDSITSGNVHVLTHGWAPGLEDWVKSDVHSGLPAIWDRTTEVEVIMGIPRTNNASL